MCVRLIHGRTELLLGMHIVKKPGVQVDFGSDQFKFGQGGWGMMTFNEKRHLVLPLVPNACDYAKLNEYSGKLQKSEMEALQTHGGFVGNWRFGKLFGRRSKWR